MKLEALSKRFDEHTAVESLDMDIREGEMCVFVGPSGCGKTTTLRMIAGFESPTGGEIRFGGRQITHLVPEKRNIGLVFQNYALFPHMKVAENVSFGLEMRSVKKAERAPRVDAILEKMQLESLRDRYPRQLSGGQQQRVALARALVTNPDVLLLDEPLANLDAKLRVEMRGYIRSLQQDLSITTIFVTHDQGEAMAIADRIAIMLDGVLQQFDSPEMIYRRPANIKVANFIGLTNVVAGRVLARSGSTCSVATEFGTLESEAPDELAPGSEVLVTIRPESLSFTGQDGPNTLSGTVTASTYLGNTLDYVVEVSPSHTLRIQSAPSERHAVGERVTVRFSADESWLIAA